ncbi:MAG: OB-fold domain-containing protein, partial [Candidatus Riflebacteria bacterium]
AARGLSRNNPYVCGVVEIEDGCRVDARIIGLEGIAPEMIRVGTKVRLEKNQPIEENQQSEKFEIVFKVID